MTLSRPNEPDSRLHSDASCHFLVMWSQVLVIGVTPCVYVISPFISAVLLNYAYRFDSRV
jgi:hypothetical protein